MNIQILSDLHFEFHRDRGEKFVRELDPTDVDVLVVAGDLALAQNGLLHALRLLCARYLHVVFVAGNHEYYNTNPLDVAETQKIASKAIGNLHWLERETVTINGIRFVGTTLWFPDDPLAFAYRRQLNDFHMIGDFDPWVFNECKASVSFLQNTVQEKDVVVTHYLPSMRSVAPRYLDSPLTRFFVCPVDDVIIKNRPKVWIHGHTHDSCGYPLEETQILCNPYGYHAHETNRQFDQKLVVTV